MSYTLGKYYRRIINNSRLLKRSIYSFTNNPRVLVNSLHKSGTHYLLNLVNNFSRLNYYQAKTYHHYLLKDDSKNLRLTQQKLRNVSSGEIIRGHIEYSKSVAEVIDKLDMKHLLMVRDPRDQIVSNYYWWERGDVSYKSAPYLFFKSLHTKSEKLNFLIQGNCYNTIKNDRSFIHFPDIISRYNTYKGWEKHNTHIVKYEDLIDSKRKVETLRRVHSYIFDKSLELKEFEKIFPKVQNAKTKTFRKGKKGSWREELTDQMIDQMNDLGLVGVLKHYGFER